MSFLLIQGTEYSPHRAGQARVGAEEEEGANFWGRAQRKSRTVILQQQQAVRSAKPLSDFGGMFSEFLSAHLSSILSLNVHNSLLQK